MFANSVGCNRCSSTVPGVAGVPAGLCRRGGAGASSSRSGPGWRETSCSFSVASADYFRSDQPAIKRLTCAPTIADAVRMLLQLRSDRFKHIPIYCAGTVSVQSSRSRPVLQAAVWKAYKCTDAVQFACCVSSDQISSAATLAMEDDGMPWSGEDGESSEDEANVESDQAETLSDGTTYVDWPSPFGFPAPLMEGPQHRGLTQDHATSALAQQRAEASPVRAPMDQARASDGLRFWIARSDAKHVDVSCPLHPDPRKLVMKIGIPLNSHVVDLAEDNGISLMHSLSCYGTRQVLGTMRFCSCTPLETIKIALAHPFGNNTSAVVIDPRPPNVQAYHWILQ